jgi:hypothetical protein
MIIAIMKKTIKKIPMIIKIEITTIEKKFQKMKMI